MNVIGYELVCYEEVCCERGLFRLVYELSVIEQISFEMTPFRLLGRYHQRFFKHRIIFLNQVANIFNGK